MKVTDIVGAYRLQCLIEKHKHHFNDYEQKFLVSILASAKSQSDVTSKQFEFGKVLIHKLKVYEDLSFSDAKRKLEEN